MSERDDFWFQLCDRLHADCERDLGHPVEPGSQEWREWLRKVMPGAFAQEREGA